MSDHFFSSFFGSFFGFLFALGLFYITEWIKRSRLESELRKLLVKDFKFNLLFFTEWIETIERILRDVSAGNSQTYGYLKYSDFLSHFLQRCYQEGIISNLIEDMDLKEISSILSRYSADGETHINGFITAWQNKTIDKQEITKQFNFELEQLKKHRKKIEELITKFNSVR